MTAKLGPRGELLMDVEERPRPKPRPASVPRGYPLKFWLAGREAEVANAVKETGVDSAMVAFGLRYRPTFVKWLNSNKIEWKPGTQEVKPHSVQRMDLRNHRKTVARPA
jgi:hypothetical protein